MRPRLWKWTRKETGKKGFPSQKEKMQTVRRKESRSKERGKVGRARDGASQKLERSGFTEHMRRSGTFFGGRPQRRHFAVKQNSTEYGRFIRNIVISKCDELHYNHGSCHRRLYKIQTLISIKMYDR